MDILPHCTYSRLSPLPYQMTFKALNIAFNRFVWGKSRLHLHRSILSLPKCKGRTGMPDPALCHSAAVCRGWWTGSIVPPRTSGWHWRLLSTAATCRRCHGWPQTWRLIDPTLSPLTADLLQLWDRLDKKNVTSPLKRVR